MDGIQYACVSKNLANGFGSFWLPYLSETWWKAGSNYFMEHPPLVYWIQSIFFKLLGDSTYIERIYTLITAFSSAYLIIKIWKLIPLEKQINNSGWLPVLLWIITPVCYWSFQNNMHENTMTVFVLLSSFFILKALFEKQQTYLFILGGIAIFLSALSKGVPGIFPLTIIFIFYISYRSISFKKALIYSSITFLIPTLIFSVILLNESAYQSLTFYIENRLTQRILEEPVVTNRFHIITQIIMELLPAIIIGTTILSISKIKQLKVNSKLHSKTINLFLLIGISGSIPLITTSVQKGFYLVPSIPFFSLAISAAIAPILNTWIQKIDTHSTFYKTIKWCSIFFLFTCLTLSYSQIGKSGKDKSLLHDIHLIGKEIPNGSTIQIEQSIYDEWNLQFYLLRNYDLSCSTDPSKYKYIIAKKNYSPTKNLEKIPLNTNEYDLFKINKH